MGVPGCPGLPCPRAVRLAMMRALPGRMCCATSIKYLSGRVSSISGTGTGISDKWRHATVGAVPLRLRWSYHLRDREQGRPRSMVLLGKDAPGVLPGLAPRLAQARPHTFISFGSQHRNEVGASRTAAPGHEHASRPRSLPNEGREIRYGAGDFTLDRPPYGDPAPVPIRLGVQIFSRVLYRAWHHKISKRTATRLQPAPRPGHLVGRGSHVTSTSVNRQVRSSLKTVADRPSTVTTRAVCRNIGTAPT